MRVVNVNFVKSFPQPLQPTEACPASRLGQSLRDVLSFHIATPPLSRFALLPSPCPLFQKRVAVAEDTCAVLHRVCFLPPPERLSDEARRGVSKKLISQEIPVLSNIIKLMSWQIVFIFLSPCSQPGRNIFVEFITRWSTDSATLS